MFRKACSIMWPSRLCQPLQCCALFPAYVKFYSKATEQDARVEVDKKLSTAGWPNSSIVREQQMTCPDTRKVHIPDYLCKDAGKDIMIIEAKRPSPRSADEGLKQAKERCKAFGIPIACGTNGHTWKYYHMVSGKALTHNGNILKHCMPYELCSRFVVCPDVTDPEDNQGIKDLLEIFRKANDVLRADGMVCKGETRLMTFCTILFLKLYSEQQNTKLPPNQRWKEWCEKKPDDMNNAVFCGRTGVLDTLFKEYDSVHWQKIERFRKEETLKKLVDLLDGVKLLDNMIDVKGAAFEYFLKAYQSGSEKKSFGEYYTPREVVSYMVSLVNPRYGETVFDPFAGSGGILTQAYAHIKARIDEADDEESKKKARLTILNTESIHGNEITNNVLLVSQLTQMNMILAGDGHSNIQKKDSLAVAQKSWTEASLKSCAGIPKYDVVITNMPFGLDSHAKYQQIGPLFSSITNHACVQMCVQSVQPGGQLCMIVPEGILINDKDIQLRKYIYESGEVKSITYLPENTFSPYFSGRTAILHLCKHSKGNDKQDGFGTGFGETREIQKSVSCIVLPKLQLKATTQQKIDTLNDELNKVLKNCPQVEKVEKVLNPNTLESKPFKILDKCTPPEGFTVYTLCDIIEKVPTKEVGRDSLEIKDIPQFTLKSNFGGFLQSEDHVTPAQKVMQVESNTFVFNPSSIAKGAIAFHAEPFTVFTSPLYIKFKIKPENYIDPSILLAAMKTKYFQEQINAVVRGTVSRDSVAYAIFSKLKIVLPSSIDRQIDWVKEKQDAEKELCQASKSLAFKYGLLEAADVKWKWV